MDRENSCESMQLFAPKTKQINLIFSGSPAPACLGQGHAGQQPWEERCSGTSLVPSPITDITPLPRPSASGFVPPGLVKRVCDRRRNKRHRTGWLLARAGYVSPCCKVVSMCHGNHGICAFVLRFFFFLFSHCTPQWSIVWGLFFFFSSLSSCKCCIFLPFPVFLFCLPHCQMYVVYV